MIEGEDSLAHLGFHRLVTGTPVGDLHSVILGQRVPEQSVGHDLLIAGMNVPTFSYVDDDGFAPVFALVEC